VVAIVALAGGLVARQKLAPKPVTTAPVVRGVAVQAIYATGSVEAEDRVVVKAKTSGSIAEIVVREGALVKRGDLLARIDNPFATLELERGKVDLAAMLKHLALKQINEVHVEAGHKLNGSLLREDLVDELLTYLAPQLMGQGRGMTNLGPFTSLAYAKALSFHEVTQIGPDLRILARLSR
jgi:diaminohydroxyphosphoribosylaminopyrimidine deaminase/5-amino-6-(5-phosphoribosylamino)uracil reductase